ncbi:TraE/TraK family type IV conjugative transfer system protein [Photorhabdus tasmaniensis]
MKFLSSIKLPFLNKTSNGDASEQDEPNRNAVAESKGRFFDSKKGFSHEAESSEAGITYSALIRRDNKLLRINTIAIAVIAALVVKTQFFTDAVTIVTPPNMTEEVTIVGNKASESYKTQWALFFSTLIGNINPTNIKFVTTYVLDALSPDLQAKTGEALQQQINIMQARGVEQSFKPNDIYYDPKNDMVYVWGTKSTRLINVPDKTESSKWTYEWVMGMKNGRPRIAYVNQYAGTPNIKKITINGKEQLATLDNPPPSTGN